MSFRSFKGFPTALVLVMSLALSSCKWTGETELKPKQIEIKNQVGNCFTDFSLILESYLKSEISEGDISVFLSCAKKSIDDFMRKTTENNPDRGYSRVEVQSLLRTFLVSDGSIVDSEKYARLFLIIKRAFLGGEVDFLSRSEWAKLKNMLPLLEGYLVNSKPYTQYYYFYDKTYYKDKNHNFKLLDNGHEEFEERLMSFLEELKNSGGQLNKLEVKYLKDQLTRIESLKHIEPLLEEMIHIFYSFPASQHQENWIQLINVAEKGLRIMTYVKKSILQKNQSIFRPYGGVAISALIRSVIQAFETTHNVNSNLNLDQELIERFVVSLNQSGFFLNGMNDPEQITEFVSNVGKSIFVYDSNKKWHISNLKINQFKFMFNRWMWSLISSFEDSSYWDLREQYENLIFNDVDFDSQSEIEGKGVYTNIVSPSSINLAFPSSNFKVNFQVPDKTSQMDSVTSKFYQTMLTNVVLFVFDTYGKQSRLSQNEKKHVSENTSARFYNDIRSVAISEGLGSPLSCDGGGRTFLESNLFTYSANGNDKIEANEALEWLAIVTSSGSVASQLFDDIAAVPDCALPGTSTFQKKPYVKKDCVRNHILVNYRKYFSHMPNLIEFIESQDKVDDFYTNLFEVTRTCADPKLPVTYDEIVYSVSLLGYIEALFERYDVEKSSYFFFERSRNDLLELDELSLAFDERFKSVLKRIAKLRNGVDLSDARAKHLFRKLLIYKKLPPTPATTLEGLWWLASDRGVAIRPLTRIDIYKIFNSILMSNEVPEVSSRYCHGLSLAWEEYLQQDVFDVEVPERVCEKIPPLDINRTNVNINR